MNALKSAVILAGGIGSRLRPITDTLPKPLVPSPEIPIIQMLLEQLLRHNFEKVYLLLGYKSKMIIDFVSSLNLNLEIVFIETPVDWTPEERLEFSHKVFPDKYMLMYSDNFVSDKDLANHLNNSSLSGSDLCMLVEKRQEGNVGIEGASLIFQPRIRRTQTPFVELGYLIVNNSDIFHQVLLETKSTHLTFEYFAKVRKITASIIEDDLISISTLERYNLLRKERKIVLLDRDGILNAKMPVADYVKSFSDYRRNENVWKILSSASTMYYLDFLVITNQPGVSRGMVTREFLSELHSKMTLDGLIAGFNILAFYVCEHGWNESCSCRKPLPGLIEKAKQDFELREERLFFIGDEERDMEAAKAAKSVGRLLNSEVKFDVLWYEILGELGRLH
jgi:D-glycero-D-manno-heptose 1,7-bisphosphate phosphatase